MRFLSFWFYQRAVGNPPRASAFAAARLLLLPSPCGRGFGEFRCLETVSRGSDVPPGESLRRVCRLGCCLPSILSDRPEVPRST